MDRAILLEPRNRWYRIARAELLLDCDDAMKALADLESIKDGLPEEPAVFRLMGSALYGAGRREESLRFFSRAIELDPKDYDLRIGRAKALADTANTDESVSPSAALRVILLDEGGRIAVKAVASKGRERLTANDLDAALEDFGLVLAHDPDNLEALTLRGFALMKSGDVAGAEADFGAALAHGVRPGYVKYNMARSYRNAGDLVRAEELFGESLRHEIKFNTHFQRGLTRASLGSHAGALEDLDAALVLRPGDRHAMSHRAVELARVGRTLDSDEQFREVERLQPDDKHNISLWIEQLIARNEPAQAIEVVARAIVENPTSGDLYALRGRAHIALRQYQTALEDLTLAHDFGADRTLVALDRARCFSESGSTSEAASVLSLVADLSSPYQYAALATRATMRRKLRDFEGAFDDYSRAIDLDATNSRLLVGRACLLMEEKRFAEAIIDLDEALEIDPSSEEALFHRSEARARSGDSSGAVADLDRLVEGGAPPRRTSYLRGSISFNLGDWLDASSHFRTALDAEDGPKKYEVMSSLAAAYDNMGNFGDAEALFRQIVGSNPSPEKKLMLGIAISQQGREGEARAAFSEVRKSLGADSELIFQRSVLPGLLLEEARVRADWESTS
ncbi:hypothetical protein AWU67_12490 [Microterricola viridarii]|uniref:Uncharacterized protein n=2 Tax=Microterricola viridarii TaxID=412690 RepID=A0A0X8E5S6_9MICO|nr:hypothetical protein AWU67_12490 [Microterricola viridarii]